MFNARLIVDRAAILSNWNCLRALRAGAPTGAVVKADAYGLGAPAVTQILSAAGCRDFFVATPSEVGPVVDAVAAVEVAVEEGGPGAALVHSQDFRVFLFAPALVTDEVARETAQFLDAASTERVRALPVVPISPLA